LTFFGRFSYLYDYQLQLTEKVKYCYFKYFNQIKYGKSADIANKIIAKKKNYRLILQQNQNLIKILV
jgi:hypothetical protein